MVTKARPTHYNTRYKYDLSPRQREVLDLIARGRTNGEIAETLGISLAGAKWHVAEILSKLNVDSREQAADYWRAYNRPLAKLARAVGGFSLGGGMLKAALAGAGILALGAMGLVVYAALANVNSDNSPAAPSGDDELSLCAPGEAVLAGTADASNAGTIIHLAVSATEPCRFDQTVIVEVHDRDQAMLKVGGNPLSLPLDADLVSGPATVDVLWSNWCDAPVAAALTATTSQESRLRIDIPTPSCTDPAQGSLLELEDATGQPATPVGQPTATVPAPGPSGTPAAALPHIDFAREIERLVQAGDVTGIMAFGEPQDFTCPPPGTQGAGQPLPLCEGAPGGEVRQGYRVANYSSEGQVVTEAALAALIAANVGGQAELASIGCPVGDIQGCSRYTLAFSLPEPSQFFVIGFEEPAGGGPPRLVVYGRGDIEQEVLQGGNGPGPFGQTAYLPVN